jgi:hypothetical protein
MSGLKWREAGHPALLTGQAAVRGGCSYEGTQGEGGWAPRSVHWSGCCEGRLLRSAPSLFLRDSLARQSFLHTEKLFQCQ